MRTIFTLKDFPFLLTLLFGLLGYQIDKISSSILDSPSIEYALQEVSSKDSGDVVQRHYECMITNITNDKSFKNLTIKFLCKEKNSLEIFSPQLDPISPSSRHYENEPESRDNHLLIYTILTLQPGDRYRLSFESTLNRRDAKSEPVIYLTSGATVRIIKKSLSTLFVKNFMAINISLAFLWLILIAFYILKFDKIQKHEKNN